MQYKNSCQVKKVCNIEYNYIEYTAIALLMFIPLTNRGNILRLTIVFVFFLRRLIKQRFRIKIDKEISMIILLTIMGIFLSSLFVFFVEYYINYNLWMHEITRMLFYILIFIEIPKIVINFEYVYNSSVFILLFHTSIQIIQKLGIFNINNWIKNIYTDPMATTTHLVITGYLGSGFRSGSIFINPNVYMIIPCVILCIILQKNILNNHIMNYALCLVTFLSMVLTGSRTCLIVAAAIILVYLISNTIKNDEKIALIGVLIVILLYIIFNNITSSYRVFSITNGIEGSLSIKFRNFIDYMRFANPVYWFVGGLGSSASSIQIDAEWGYLIQYYGIIGVIWYILLIVINPVKHSPKLNFFMCSSKIVIVMIAFSATIVFCMPIYPYVSLLTLSQINIEKFSYD